MPRSIDPPAAPEYDLAEVAARLDESGVDLSDEASLARCTGLLAGLARNRDFLAGRIIAELKASYADQLAANRYSAQVFLLHRSPRGFFLRANLWPAATDAVYAASGGAAFAYGVPHDHNFSFLTTGYWGPGYVSDYYDYDAEQVDGRLGELLPLRFVERSVLNEGRMMLYRAHRDIHSQFPPERLSISLNIMDEGEHVPWRDQYIVDLEQRTIARRPTLSSGEMLLRCAVHLTDNGKDVAEQFARMHPVPRVRANAIAALAAVEEGAGRAAVLERGLGDADARVRDDCERWLGSSAVNGGLGGADVAPFVIPAFPGMTKGGDAEPRFWSSSNPFQANKKIRGRRGSSGCSGGLGR
ncbi:transposase [Sphingopyxis sp.]|uniref:transposase n=1 Tax=Sphingopyxis sp. TaxID=1908224 RepID=UPI002622996F|nr:transposase [Sphingopyxis sp.]MCW0198580.1 transposase [Sphingopyxis sp.]